MVTGYSSHGNHEGPQQERSSRRADYPRMNARLSMEYILFDKLDRPPRGRWIPTCTLYNKQYG